MRRPAGLAGELRRVRGGLRLGQVCSGASCVTSCTAGLTDCSGSCRDLDTDRANCGRCGSACAVGEACVGGACVVSCPSGQRVCSGRCVDTLTDRANCGGCGTPCPTGQLCAAGACAVSCPTGQTVCGGACVDRTRATNGCEVALASTVAHCGACNNLCPAPANGTAGCSGSQCTVAGCNAGFGNCDGNATNGCETNTQTSATNCGGCGVVCAVGSVCTNGACVASDPCANLGGLYANVNANIRICRTLFTWGSWNAALIPAPWRPCNLTQWAAYAPSVTPQSVGIAEVALWIDNSACGAGSHREVFYVFPMNQVSCYDGPSCCHSDSSRYPLAICQP